MFLAITGHGTTNCSIQKCFQHFGETISQYFPKVLNALVLMHAYYVQLPINTNKIDAQIRKDFKYEPYFEDCLGTLDRTYIFIYVFYKLNARSIASI